MRTSLMNRARFIAILMILTLSTHAALLHAQPTSEQGDTEAHLGYTEETGESTLVDETQCNGASLVASIDCVAERMEAANGTESLTETANASVRYSLRARLEALSDGTQLLTIDATSQGLSIINELPRESLDAVTADHDLVLERLRAWQYSLAANEIDQLRSAGEISIPLVRPFEGLQALALQQPVHLSLRCSDLGQAHPADSPCGGSLVRFVINSGRWESPQELPFLQPAYVEVEFENSRSEASISVLVETFFSSVLITAFQVEDRLYRSREPFLLVPTARQAEAIQP